jgi:hypothetical protein
LALRPHPLARWGVVGLSVLLLAFVLQVALQGTMVAAAVLLVISLLTVFVLWSQLYPTDGGAPRRLRLAADGRAWIFTACGGVDEIHLHPASVRLGRAVLLVARGQRMYRLLIGPGNVDPVTLAALQRWLRQPAAPVSLLR